MDFYSSFIFLFISVSCVYSQAENKEIISSSTIVSSHQSRSNLQENSVNSFNTINRFKYFDSFDKDVTNYMPKTEQPQIFINQSNNIYILAKYGQTVSLPCIIIRQKNQDLSNIHAVWHKLVEKQRPIVLSVGSLQLKQDMRFRVKQVILNDQPKNKNYVSDEPLVYDDTKNIKQPNPKTQNSEVLENSDENDQKAKNLVENWQFEIRRLNYGDAGTYQCLLPLVKPIAKNITLQVIPDLTMEPKEGNFKLDEKIIIKCKATLRSHHRNSLINKNQHLHQRQQKPTINWYKENDVLKNENGQNGNQKIEISTFHDHEEHMIKSTLTINNARMEDAGKYRCIYDNIQEQTVVKISNDNYEYKNFLGTSGSYSTYGYLNFSSKILISIYLLILFCYKF